MKLGRPPAPTVFMHVPKTAGTSVIKALADQAVAAGIPVCKFLYASDLVFTSDVDGLGAYKMFMGHIGFEQIRWLIGPAKICAFYRDPVDRVLSNYFWWRDQHMDAVVEIRGDLVKVVDSALCWEEDLLRILSNTRDCWKFNELRNVQAFQTASCIYGRTESCEQTLRRALANLERMAYVGLFDRLGDDYGALSHSLFGECSVALTQEKASRHPTAADVDGLIKSKIKSENELDLVLYDAARRRADGGSRFRRAANRVDRLL